MTPAPAATSMAPAASPASIATDANRPAPFRLRLTAASCSVAGGVPSCAGSDLRGGPRRHSASPRSRS